MLTLRLDADIEADHLVKKFTKSGSCASFAHI